MNSEIENRAKCLFSFLSELNQLKSRVIRTIDQYEDVLWLHEIPKEKGCACFIWRSEESNKESNELLRISKPKFVAPPSIPSVLEPWIDPTQLKESKNPPDLLEQSIDIIPAQQSGNIIKNRSASSKLSDHPEIKGIGEQYLKTKWTPWAEKDLRHRKIQNVYSQLFSIYQKQQKLGEAYEVVIGIGLLTWKTPKRQEIKRHLITLKTNLNFDFERGIFIVESPPESAQFLFEQDMLEPEEQPSLNELKIIEQRLQELSGNAWDFKELDAIFESWINAVQSRGCYVNDLVPSFNIQMMPHVTFAPAIILRKRSESGFKVFFETIIDQIQNTQELPEGIIHIISDLGNNANRPEDPIPDAIDDPEELYFPLPTNDEQKSILYQLNRSYGTVVQGPPGTGKSHTIANLVCHLLAEGKKILITSHTARALQVLVNKIPENVSDLCVLLLGNDRAAKLSLEKSVGKILSEYHRWTLKKNLEKINSLKNELDAVRREKAELVNQLTLLREAETKCHQLSFGSYKGTLSQITKQLNKEAPNFAWFSANGEINQNTLITNLELIHLLNIFRQFKRLEKSDEIKLSTYLKKFTELNLITADAFSLLVSKEKCIKEMLNKTLQFKDHILYLQFNEQSKEYLEEINEELIKYIGGLEKNQKLSYSWCLNAMRQVIDGQIQIWSDLYDVTSIQLNLMGDKVPEISNWHITGFGRRDTHVVRQHALDLKNHFANGGKIGIGPFKPRPVKDGYYLIKEVRVNGQLCNNQTTLSQLIEILDVHERLTILKNAWIQYAKPPQGTFQVRRAVFENFKDTLRIIIDFRVLYENLMKKISTINEFQQPEWCNLAQLYQLKKIIEAIILEKDLKGIQSDIQHLETKIYEHLFEMDEFKPWAEKILNIIKRHDDIEYRIINKKIEDIKLKIKEKISIMQYGLDIYEKFYKAFPQIAENLKASFKDSSWDARLHDFDSAWNWYRADQWLKEFVRPNEYERLTILLDHRNQKIRELLSEVAAALAWRNCLSKMTDFERQHLEAWRQAITKLGKGTGKYANKYRRDAQYHLEKSRSAIPAWIMPIYRIVETVRPEKKLFDVVIIDEASQSGPEALFLQYIAQKIVIVGDDKQISPDNVGVSIEDVMLLRKRWIADIPFAEFIGIEYSFFQYASIRFGNVIRLREHFRCMPEIIQFSNNLCYSSDPLIPLRQYGANRITPVVVTRYIADGYQKGKSPRIINPPEAQVIVDQIKICCDDILYDKKTFGVISLLGYDQARYIEKLLLDQFGPEEMEKRQLVCGDAYAFQGDERDVIFLSMVSAPTEGSIIGTLASQRDERRFNVAASRAKDQMWLCHSVQLNDLSPKCLRYNLLEYCLNPKVVPLSITDQKMKELIKIALNRYQDKPDSPFESWFEAEVYLQIIKRGYQVIPQYEIDGYRIDLLIVGIKNRLAVECDGDAWHGMDRYEEDMSRQRRLERCGLIFWRIRGSDYYRNPEESLISLWKYLNDLEIIPSTPLRNDAFSS